MFSCNPIQFASEPVSQMLVMVPIRIGQLTQLFAPLEAVNAYYQENYIEGLSSQFDKCLIIMDRLQEFAKVNQLDSQTIQYIEKIRTKIDVFHYKLILPMKLFCMNESQEKRDSELPRLGRRMVSNALKLSKVTLKLLQSKYIDISDYSS